jgi:hypothetical protein
MLSGVEAGQVALFSRRRFIFCRAKSRPILYLIYIMQEQYFVYIFLCNDHSYYVGLTVNVLKEFEEHQQGANSNAYTFNRRPVELKYYEIIPF